MVTLYNRPALTREASKARAVRMMEMMAHGYTVHYLTLKRSHIVTEHRCRVNIAYFMGLG